MRLPSINLDRSAFANFESTIRKEWLVTNGLGGYASSTVLGINTRKYHGLLVATVHPPKDRRVFLEKLDEDVISDGKVRRFGANEFSDTFFPKGHDFLQHFSLSPFPAFVYAADKVTIQKTIFMPYGKNGTIVLYNVSNQSNGDIKFRIFPLINCRNFHSVTKKSHVLPPSQEHQESMVKLGFKDPKATLLLKSTEGQYFVTDKWTEKLYFREEAARGESCLNDCYQPGYFETTVEAKTDRDLGVAAVAAEDEKQAEETFKGIPSTTPQLRSLHEREIERYQDQLDRFYNLHNISPSDWLNWLVLAAGSFVVDGSVEKEKSVMAGYHWFGVWGRDTFVSLPGLMIVTRRFEEAKEIFLAFARCTRKGLIPNFVSEEGSSSAYNTVDATLWYVNAVLQYLKYSGDFDFVGKNLWKALKQMIENHVEGTMFDIHMDADGLLSHGPQLTWVDSSIDGKPVTPRAGKAVEIQALWYNALKTMELLANRFHDNQEAEKYASISEKAQKNFVSKFWNLQNSRLYDSISEKGADSSLRPNQILAASLDFVMLNNERNEKVVEVVRNELLTTAGLRTLSRNDRHYVGVYVGDRPSRDRAYHSGTVWPWLLGPFTTAFLKAKGHAEAQREYAFNSFLKPLLTAQIYEAGLGTIGEIFDGNPPHTPRGCISQAWSVAEPFRAYVEDVLQIRPQYEGKILKSLR